MSGDDDSRCKENVADDVTAASDNTAGETEKTSAPRPSIVRKRSYSFSDGKC